MAALRGVNLGGWFVLEQWMKPTLFEGVSGPDETVFSIEKPNASSQLEHHRKDFIQEKDIQTLSEMGINSVRLPLPWWFLGEPPYVRSIETIDLIIGWLEKYQLNYLLDLHTAPGCQNGFDNGGITGKIDWPKSQANIDKTIEKLVFLTQRFGKNPHFFGIEALNEPHASIDLSLIQNFYLRTYQALRPLTQGTIVFHDAFRPQDPSWPAFFGNNGFENVALDAHLYYCFSPTFAGLSLPQLLNAVLVDTHGMLQNLSKFVRVIVGEWSLGLDEKRFATMDAFQKDTFLKAFASAQLTSYESVFGWYFWSYRIERESHRSWDFSRLIQAGIFPRHY